MSLISKIRQRAAGVHTEFLTNLEAPEYINGLEENTGSGCRLSSTNNMENSTMDAEAKKLLEQITDKVLELEAAHKRAKAAPAPAPRPTPTAEDVAAREALLQYARETAEMKQMEKEMFEKTGLHFVD